MEEEHIRVMFYEDFERHNQAPFHVRFRFDRISMRRMHHAVDRCNLDVVWPLKASLDADCTLLAPSGRMSDCKCSL